MADQMRVKISYTNWRGEKSVRIIEPQDNGLVFGFSKWHPERQWLLMAIDVEKGELRGFAMKDIHSWEPAYQ